MTRRARFSGTIFTLGFAIAAAAGAGGAAILIPDDAPASLQAAAALTEVDSQQEDFTDARTVEVQLAVTDPTPLTSNASGVVSALGTGAGLEVASGTSPLAVSGVPILALHTSVPLYRDLESGAKGDDVRALQEELVRLGYDVAADGYYGWGTSEAVRLLKKAIGQTDPDRSLALTDLVWLPSTTVTTTDWSATLGSTVTAGGSYGNVPGQLTAVSLGSTPSALAPGARTLTLWGQSTSLDEQNRATDPDFLSAVAATDDYAAVIAAPDEQSPTATLELTDALPTIKLPPTALFAVDGQAACVQSGETALPVTVVGSALGSSLVTLDDGGEIPETVRIGTGISEESCR